MASHRLPHQASEKCLIFCAIQVSTSWVMVSHLGDLFEVSIFVVQPDGFVQKWELKSQFMALLVGKVVINPCILEC